MQEPFARSGEGDYLMVVDAGGSQPREVGRWDGGCCYHGAFGGLLEWSGDGTLLATPIGTSTDSPVLVFAADGSGERPSIYVVDSDGADQRWLADGDYPQWSP